ncbi:hypothetical protein PoB_003072600 [Plakobranchus ocellatus]|uniref:Uncharacterized protein n=1 Tax=Plakobranchus ocellatus TaxID=259542 RepID=A0AAV4A7J5_9GAST|nr:hypothetical protein PoB_003072600 [Plakobranchus ocellatus]
MWLLDVPQNVPCCPFTILCGIRDRHTMIRQQPIAIFPPTSIAVGENHRRLPSGTRAIPLTRSVGQDYPCRAATSNEGGSGRDGDSNSKVRNFCVSLHAC